VPAPDEVLVVVDMQRVVAEETPWQIAGVRDILPPIIALAEAFRPSTIYTRHVPPADGGTGTWRRFYAAWGELSRDPSIWDLMPELAGRDGLHTAKSVYSCFGSAELRDELARRDAPELVLCGVETDCCVLATALEAVDRGIPVTVVEDAVRSPSRAGHDGALALCRRLPEQVAVATSAELLAARQGRT
jgi:nicotinamidase-related amidase